MLILEYHPDGICVPDVKTMEAAESFVPLANDVIPHKIQFSQAMILDAFRVLIKRGQVDPANVKIVYGDHNIYPDIDGRLSNWPSGFCDHMENYLMEIF